MKKFNTREEATAYLVSLGITEFSSYTVNDLINEYEEE
jgi:hypothetical protein